MRPWPIHMALSLERRIQIGFAIGVAIIVTVGAVALRSSSATLESAAWVAHTLDVRSALAQALASLVRDHLISAMAHGQAESDWSSVAKVAARDAGLI